jgi:hypothetical protein
VALRTLPQVRVTFLLFCVFLLVVGGPTMTGLQQGCSFLLL